MTTRTATEARRTSSLYFIAALAFGALWTALRLVPDETDLRLLVLAEFFEGPAFAAMLVCTWLAFRYQGWAAGFEDGRSRERSEESTP